MTSGAPHPSNPSKSSKLPRLVANALTIVLLIVLGLQIAWWGWHFLAPPPSAAPSSPPTPGGEDLALARQLFGDAGSADTGKGAATDIRLKGVFAVDGVTLSAAVVNMGAKDQAVRVGEEIQKGITLAEVEADHIIVSRNGVRERVGLDRYQPAVATAAGATRAPPASSGFRLNVSSTAPNGYSLSRQELNTVLQDPRQMEFLGRIGVAPGGGVRIDDAPANTLAGKLGLKSGDVIAAINGQPVNSAGDLARLYSQFNTISSVRVEVRRSGTPTVLNYSVQN
jgi:general secretion pathway protein C